MKKIALMLSVAMLAACSSSKDDQTDEKSEKKDSAEQVAQQPEDQSEVYLPEDEEVVEAIEGQPFKGEFVYSDGVTEYTIYMDLYDQEPGDISMHNLQEGGYMGMVIESAHQVDDPGTYIVVSGGDIPSDPGATACRMFVNLNPDGSITLMDENGYVFKEPVTFKRVSQN